MIRLNFLIGTWKEIKRDPGFWIVEPLLFVGLIVLMIWLELRYHWITISVSIK